MEIGKSTNIPNKPTERILLDITIIDLKLYHGVILMKQNSAGMKQTC